MLTMRSVQAVLPPGPARDWLNQPIKQRIQMFMTESNQLESWSALLFVEQVSPTKIH